MGSDFSLMYNFILKIRFVAPLIVALLPVEKWSSKIYTRNKSVYSCPLLLEANSKLSHDFF